MKILIFSQSFLVKKVRKLNEIIKPLLIFFRNKIWKWLFVTTYILYLPTSLLLELRYIQYKNMDIYIKPDKTYAK